MSQENDKRMYEHIKVNVMAFVEKYLPDYINCNIVIEPIEPDPYKRYFIQFFETAGYKNIASEIKRIGLPDKLVVSEASYASMKHHNFWWIATMPLEVLRGSAIHFMLPVWNGIEDGTIPTS